MNSIKKYGLELIIVAMFLVINTFIIVYFNGEIKAEQRLAQKSHSVTDVAKNVDNSENKEDNSETSSADTKTSEAEVKTGENTDTETSVVKEPEKKLEEPKVKPQSKNKQDEYYEMIEDFYFDLCYEVFSEKDIKKRLGDLEGKIPDSYKLRNGRTIARVMVNEICARYGYTFNNRKLQEFYNKKEWYKKLKNKITTSNLLKRQEKVLQRIKNKRLRKYYKYLGEIA